VPFGYGIRSTTISDAHRELAGATCNGNTSEVRQYTGRFIDDHPEKGRTGAIKAGAPYSTRALRFTGVGGAPRTDDATSS